MPQGQRLIIKVTEKTSISNKPVLYSVA